MERALDGYSRPRRAPATCTRVARSSGRSSRSMRRISFDTPETSMTLRSERHLMRFMGSLSDSAISSSLGPTSAPLP